VDSPTQPHHPPVCPRYNAAPPPKRCPVRVPDTVGGNSKPGHTPKRVNIGQTYTHCPVQGCLGRHPVSVASQGRTLSTAACPGAPATPPRYGQGCPLPCPANFGGWAKTGHPVHASTDAVARHTPGWCTGPGYLPGCPDVGGFSITQPLPPPCVCRRQIRAFVADPRTRQVCAWLVAHPATPCPA
jgi:hypothetical protein